MTDPRPAASARLPSGPGVYRFRDERGRILYIGRAGNLRRRVRSYWGGLGDRRYLRRMVRQVARLEALACDSEHEAAWVERNLLEHRRPYWNRMVGGLEVPVIIRLDPRPRAPRLDVVHEVEPAPGVLHFGPYLGGNKVRLAVSALQRVFPLAYTAEGAGGSIRDLARVRGIDPDDRDGVVAAIVAVLRREGDAVAALRVGLARRRDEAAAALAFELAARVVEEGEAVDWVLADQRAAGAEAVDVDAYGWADGVLVELRVRAGRLREWTQRPCGEVAARPHLAATPPDWVEFARRNADLAARLAGP
jgi:excinuclease UvrABC nuclease subunit